MNKHIDPKEYLALILTRVGGASPKQLQELCMPVMSKTALYRHLRRLVREGYAERQTHPTQLKFAYKATEKALKGEFDHDERARFGRPRSCELGHTLLVTDTLVTFSKYANVTGITLEHELCEETLREFNGCRRPDAIIQLTNSHGCYEIAIEAENSLKSKDRIKNVLESYETCFEKDIRCSGVIIVCGKKDIFNCYSEELAKRNEEHKKRILLTTPERLLDLNERIYGPIGTEVRMIWDLRRTESEGGISYISARSSSYGQ